MADEPVNLGPHACVRPSEVAAIRDVFAFIDPVDLVLVGHSLICVRGGFELIVCWDDVPRSQIRERLGLPQPELHEWERELREKRNGE